MLTAVMEIAGLLVHATNAVGIPGFIINSKGIWDNLELE